MRSNGLNPVARSNHPSNVPLCRPLARLPSILPVSAASSNWPFLKKCPIKLICLCIIFNTRSCCTPARRNTSAFDTFSTQETWWSIKVNCYTDWQRMVAERCTARTVLGMLNQAAQKFIFTLEKISMGLGHVPPPWIHPWFDYRQISNASSFCSIVSFWN